MTLIVAGCVAIIFAVSIYMLLGGELKGIAMGAFLLSHAANLSILSMSGSPVTHAPDGSVSLKTPPLLGEAEPAAEMLTVMVDPLPQALILTAIVISFATMAFLLTMIVVTGRSTQTLDVGDLAREQLPTPSSHPS